MALSLSLYVVWMAFESLGSQIRVGIVYFAWGKKTVGFFYGHKVLSWKERSWSVCVCVFLASMKYDHGNLHVFFVFMF